MEIPPSITAGDAAKVNQRSMFRDAKGRRPRRKKRGGGTRQPPYEESRVAFRYSMGVWPWIFRKVREK